MRRSGLLDPKSHKLTDIVDVNDDDDMLVACSSLSIVASATTLNIYGTAWPGAAENT